MLWTLAGVLLQVAAAADPELLREARNAQSRFESIRRMHLPRERSGSPDRCDARIGRFCYWYDSTETNVVPEPARIRAARRQLLGVLERATRASPEDGWLAGQRVRYLVEAEQFGDAVAAARACRAEAWWCAALLGFALHADQRYLEADTIYARALAAMPAGQRCEWLDLRRMVPGPLARTMQEPPCAERARLAHILWEVSRPLFSTRGNDIRTEHFARHTLAIVRARSASAHGMAWGDDTRELLLRYGSAEWYTRSDPRPGSMENSSVVGHDREPSYAFYPEVRSVHGVPWIGPGDWRLRASGAPSRYAPRHVRGIVSLPHQLARFPRGDSMLVVATVAVEDSALREDSVTLTLGALDRTLRRRIAHGGPALSLTLPADSVLIGVEAYGSGTRRVGWARYSIAPPPCALDLCVSDLLLTHGTEHPRTLDDAVRRARTATAIPATEPLGVAWEVRASASRQPVRMTLTVERVGIGLARRLAARLGLTDLPAPVHLQWSAVTESARLEHVTLRLPPGARGRHRIELRVERGAQDVRAMREVELLP